MSELWICRETTAGTPFWLEPEGINIFTIEELCYYLYHNIYFLEDKVIGAELFKWMEQELLLPRLGKVLTEGKQRGQNSLWCALLILQETGCYTAQELSELERLCLEMGNKTEFERRKIHADMLLQKQHYVGSIRGYFRLLQMENADGSYPILIGNIWHNLAVAHARLFLFQEAAVYFKTAYQYNQREESLAASRDALECLDNPIFKSQEEIKLPAAGEVEAYLKRLSEDYKKKVKEHGTI